MIMPYRNMKKTSEIKAIAKQRMFQRLSPLVGAVLIFGGIFIGLAVVIATVYMTQLIAKGVFSSQEALLDYMTNPQNLESSSMYDTVLSYAFELIIGALLATLSAGFTYVCLKVARNEETKASDIFAIYKMNPDRIIIIYFISFAIKFICMLPTYLCDYFIKGIESNFSMEIIVIAVNIICYTLQLCVTILLSQAYLLYIDNPEQNSVLTIRQSFELMKKRPFFIGYLLLMISFIPWYLVVACTFGFAIIWVLPFMNVSFALFYMNLKDELGNKIDTFV